MMMTTKGRVYYPLIRKSHSDVAFFKTAADREKYAIVLRERERGNFNNFPTNMVVFSACTRQIRLVTGIKITSKTDTVCFGATYTKR
jgi:hypothetical protein